MRKVLSFVLVLSLVLGSFSMAFAATPKDVVGAPSEEAVTVLTDLGVIVGYEDGTFRPENTVTRAEAAIIIIKALGLENSVGTQKSSYSDMSGYGWAEGYIAFATQLGILSGYPDGTFKPGQTVSYNEMARILVGALGYTADSLTGTWPANFVNQAAAVGIMDGIKSGGNTGANRGDVAIMANNALTAHIGSVDKDNNWNATIKSGSVANNNAVYDTMISRLGGHYAKGVIHEAMDSSINLKPYIGKYVEYYTTKELGKGSVIAVAKVLSTTIAGEYADTATDWAEPAEIFEGNDDVDYKMGNNVSSSAVEVFYNGENDNSYAFATGTAVQLEVELSGKTIKEVYSAKVWEVSNALKVKAGDLEDLNDGELLGEAFELDKKDEIIANSFELIGASALDEIKADDVVYVYVNASGDDVIRRVAVGTETVEGKVTAVDANDGWKINGEWYAFADSSIPGAATYSDKLGETAKLSLDAYGDIYKANVTSGSAKNYAVVLATDTSGTLNGNMRLYLGDETKKTFESDLKSAEWTFLTTTNDVEAVGTRLIGYGLDKNGVIDSVYPAAADGAAKWVTGSAATMASIKVIDLGGSKVVASDVVVFTKDGTNAITGVAKITDVSIGEDLGSVEALIRDNKVVALIVDEDMVTGSDTDSYAVISNKKSELNGVDEKAYLLSGFIDGKKMSNVFTANQNVPADSITAPAIFKITYNADNNISKLEITTTTALEVGTLGYTSDNFIKITGGAVEAVATDAVFYEVVFDGTDVKEYKTFNGTIKAGYKVYLFEVDGSNDKDGADIVIVDRNGL